VLLALAAGCSDDGGDEAVPPLAEELPPLPGPGTELLDGYVVPEGAELIGGLRVGPQLIYDEHEPESSWYARWVVDGDPRPVIDDLLDQAVAAGLDVRSNCETRNQTLACSGRARRVVDGYEVEQLEFTATRGKHEHGGGVSYQQWAPGVYPQDTAHAFDEADVRWSDGPPFDPPALIVEGHYPEVGESLVDHPLPPDTPLTVAEGTVVAEPVVADACGFTALLYVPGDIEPVVEHYREQFAAWEAEFGPDVERTTDRGIETIRFGASELGGLDLHFEAVVGREGEGNWATVSRCDDS
jgi:hypothetical protein